jgi:signal transduction histidine kinase/ActR/RegA family two-component response regulator
LRYSRQELLQLTPRDISAPDDGMNPVEIGNKLLAHGSTLLETMHLTKDGQLIPVESHIRLFDYDGQRAVLSIARDITERKQAKDALQESEAKYRSMMESMTDPVYICSPEFIVEYMNPAMIKRTGRDAVGEKCYSALHDLSAKCDWCILNKIADGKSLETNFVSPKDNRQYRALNMPIENKDGSVSKMTIFRDITDYLTAVAEKEKAQAQLQQIQKMESIGILAGGIAHDFNNILFPIVGYTEMLLEDVPEDSPFKNSLNQIYTSALRAQSLVKQILTFSRQENNELMLMKMQPIVKEALKLIRSTIPTNIDIKLDISPDCGVIKADPTQIHQIVMNLTTNAYHAMEETGGKLKVSLKQVEFGEYDIITTDMVPGVYACLIVADTGVGMDKNLTDKIFDPFFTTKAIGKGTGMGLSVVHGIVIRMNGAIQVYSEPGKGTQFHVYFPIEKSFSETQNTQAKEPIQGGTELILLVDDEEVILQMEKQMLERLGYQVTSRTSSLEALEAFRSNPDKFDLVITDMAMPNMPGNKLSVELTKIRPDIPVLLCTGFSETMSEEKAAHLGIKGFLLKPIIMRDLAQKLREVLDKKSIWKINFNETDSNY